MNENLFYDKEGNWDQIEKVGVAITYKVTDIDWDTDDEEEELEDLPKELKVVVSLEDGETETDAENYISDFLSDEYGYCHNGFALTEEDSTDFNYEEGDELIKVEVIK